ncbi:hypothetical protein AOLI_G00243480 [Acnodon oligacanthus]
MNTVINELPRSRRPGPRGEDRAEASPAEAPSGGEVSGFDRYPSHPLMSAVRRVAAEWGSPPGWTRGSSWLDSGLLRASALSRR